MSIPLIMKNYHSKDLTTNVTKENNVELILNKINNYLYGTAKIMDPLKIAENFHSGNYISMVNKSQLWNLKKFYETINYKIGLVDVGKKFMENSNYHGAYESFHSAKYVQGLLEIAKKIVQEVKEGNRNNIGYAKKALTDIVKLEGKSSITNLKKYINDIADAYIQEYNETNRTNHNKRIDCLHDALELYKLSNNKLKIFKTSLKMIYHNISYTQSNSIMTYNKNADTFFNF